MITGIKHGEVPGPWVDRDRGIQFLPDAQIIQRFPYDPDESITAGGMTMANDLRLVQEVMVHLERHGVITWLAGGWAEELHGLAAPRPYHDVDVLYRAGFERVDRYLAVSDVEEILAKRLSHKRAFVFYGIMIEILLVRPDLATNFWNQKRFAWPKNTFHS